MNYTILFLFSTVLFVCIIVYLLSKLLRVRQQLALIKDALEDIKKGNLNRRILARNNDMTKKICYDINKIALSNQAKLISLKQLERAYKRLMTSLSHDVKTPLTSLVGYLEAIYEKIVTGEEKDEYLKIALDKAHNLKSFVVSLFEWVKLDSKEQVFYFENYDINELSRNIIADWIPMLKDRNFTYNIDIPEYEYIVKLDINAYTRILNNLLQNVIAHSDGSIVSFKVTADDIGIIHNGVLLEESSYADLEKRNSKYILLRVSDVSKAALILEREFGVKNYSVQDDAVLRLYDTSLDMASINKALMLKDISVISSQMCNDTLEDYFKKVTGGEGIA